MGREDSRAVDLLAGMHVCVGDWYIDIQADMSRGAIVQVQVQV